MKKLIIIFAIISSNDTNGKLDYTIKQTSPTRPVCPSIVSTINKISK